MASKLTDIINDLPKSSSLSEKEDIDAAGLSQQKTLYELIRYHHDTQNRDWLAKWAAYVVSIWLSFVLIILFLNTAFFKLDKAIVIALLGTSSVNVLGLSYIVLKGYFPSDGKKKLKKMFKGKTKKNNPLNTEIESEKL